MPGTRSDFCIRSRKWSSASQWGRAYFTSITSTLSCFQGLNLTYSVTNRVQWLWWQSARHRTNNTLLTIQRTQHDQLCRHLSKGNYMNWKWEKVKDDVGAKEVVCIIIPAWPIFIVICELSSWLPGLLLFFIERVSARGPGSNQRDFRYWRFQWSTSCRQRNCTVCYREDYWEFCLQNHRQCAWLFKSDLQPKSLTLQRLSSLTQQNKVMSFNSPLGDSLVYTRLLF